MGNIALIHLAGEFTVHVCIWKRSWLLWKDWWYRNIYSLGWQTCVRRGQAGIASRHQTLRLQHKQLLCQLGWLNVICNHLLFPNFLHRFTIFSLLFTPLWQSLPHKAGHPLLLPTHLSVSLGQYHSPIPSVSCPSQFPSNYFHINYFIFNFYSKYPCILSTCSFLL